MQKAAQEGLLMTPIEGAVKPETEKLLAHSHTHMGDSFEKDLNRLKKQWL